jgi:hypothetical protein
MKVQFVAWLVGGALALLVLAGILITGLVINYVRDSGAADNERPPPT